MQQVFRLAFLVIGSLGTQVLMAQGAGAVVYPRQDFEQPGQEQAWQGWSQGHQVTITRAQPGFSSASCLRFTVPAPDWDTAIIEFKPPIHVTANTVLRFRMKYAPGSLEGINVRDATEEAEYLLSFPAHPNEWLLVQQHLAKAVYKRFGKAGTPRDGVAGDEVSSLQIAYWGSELCLDDFEVFEAAGPLPELPVLHLPAAGDYAPRRHRILQQVCPFGVISTVAAGDTRNAELFGQTKTERFEDDLLDLQRHSMNAISNFCDDDDVASRLKLMAKYRLYLVETALANADLRGAADDDARLRLVEQVRDDPRLLVWYGQDEPRDYSAYFANVMAINQRDPNHPVASAFDQIQSANVLGPLMELVMLDIYSVHGEKRSVDALAFHADLIRKARQLCAGGRVWMIPQSFSGRNGHTQVYRMPDPAEVRFDIYNTLAAGASGFLCFIYNDTCTFLDGEVRGEEFDDTLVDAWGNPCPTYEELGRLAHRLTPLMPALLDAKDVTEPAIQCPKDALTVTRMANRHGTWAFLVNRDLSQPFHGAVRLPSTTAGTVYDAVKLAPAPISSDGELQLNLAPGEGTVLLLTSPVKWAGVRGDIIRRSLVRDMDRLEVEVGVLEAAGMDVHAARAAIAGASAVATRFPLDPPAARAAIGDAREALADTRRRHPDYVKAEGELTAIREGFGAIRDLVRPVVMAVDDRRDPAWVTLREALLAASQRYFALRRAWKQGTAISPVETAALRREVADLHRRMAECVGVQATGPAPKPKAR